jgi:hypothetical protein
MVPISMGNLEAYSPQHLNELGGKLSVDCLGLSRKKREKISDLALLAHAVDEDATVGADTGNCGPEMIIHLEKSVEFSREQVFLSVIDFRTRRRKKAVINFRTRTRKKENASQT